MGKKMIQSVIRIENLGESNATVDGHALDAGASLEFTVFKGIDFKGDVRTGNRSFKVSIVDPVLDSAPSE